MADRILFIAAIVIASAAVSDALAARGCFAQGRLYPEGATIACTVYPDRPCPLGLPVTLWTCHDGRWFSAQ